MPRKRDPDNEYFRSATERSRKKAASEGRPEASFADAALAAAVYSLAKRVEEEKADGAVLRWILKAATAILTSHPGKNFDPAAAERKIVYRTGMRSVAERKRLRKATADLPLPKAVLKLEPSK